MPTGFIGKAVFPSSLNYALGGCGCLFQGSCLLCIMQWLFHSQELPLSQADTAEQPAVHHSSGSIDPGHQARAQFRIQAVQVVTELRLMPFHSNPLFSFLWVSLGKEKLHWISYSCSSVQFSSVAQSCPTLCNPMNHSKPGLPVHQLQESTQTQGDFIQDYCSRASLVGQWQRIHLPMQETRLDP